MWYDLLVACLAIIALMLSWLAIQRWGVGSEGVSADADGLSTRVGCGACAGRGCHCGKATTESDKDAPRPEGVSGHIDALMQHAAQQRQSTKRVLWQHGKGNVR